jgi:hypothetical protein
MRAMILALVAAATVGGSAMALGTGTNGMNTASTSAANAGDCVCAPCPSPCPPECQVVCCE